MENTNPTLKLIENKEPQVRLLKELRPVLKRSEKEDPDDAVVYEMYRDVYEEKDNDTIKRHNLRYDITVIHPQILKEELTKTYGHYHKNDMMEVTEVISGKAWFILQRHADHPEKIKEIYVVYVNAGEKIIYPPNFGHATINPQKDQKLITSNWISTKAESNYEPFTELQGACFYFSRNEKDEFVIEENRKYADTPEIIRLTPNELPELNITFDKPLYSLINTPGKLDFLNNPQKFKELITIDKCYTKI